MKASGVELNAISPYFTMFPLDFPIRIIEEYSSPGDLVLDPFCGRGTTNFAARLLGRKTYGIDCNPMAVAVSRAKMVSPAVEEIVSEAKRILHSREKLCSIPSGDFWDSAFNPDVLTAIVKIRNDLLDSCRSDARIALRAIMLGALHGPVNKGKPSYFSNQSPRTYAPKPDYAYRYWRTHGLSAPNVDVIEIIKDRAVRYYCNRIHAIPYTITQGDSRKKTPFTRLISQGGADLIVTSPPYPGMVSYYTDQWLRNWFMGGSPGIDYNSNSGLKSLNKEIFISDLRAVWHQAAYSSKPKAVLVCRFGVLPSFKGEKDSILRTSFQGTPWRVVSAQSAGTAKMGKRVAETQMGKKVTPANEEIDVVCEKYLI